MSHLLKLQAYVAAHAVEAVVTADPDSGDLVLEVRTWCRSVRTGEDFQVTEYARTYSDVQTILGF